MKKNILSVFLFLLTLSCFGQDSGQYEVTGGTGTPFLAIDDAHKRIKVYLLNGLTDAKITFTPASSGDQWFKFSEGGANSGIPITSQLSGNTSYITDISDGMGYFVGDPASMSTSYIWIIDYSLYVPVFNSLTVDDSYDKCEMIKLIIDINAPDLKYYSPAGAFLPVTRNYQLDYYTMEWNGAVFMKDQLKEEKMSRPNGVSEFIVDPPPLQNTEFIFSGDQIAEHFGMGKSMKTPEYEAVAVQAEIITDSLSNISDNQMTGEDGSISAPVDMRFTAYANEPVATFYTWKIYNLSRSKTDPVSQTTSRILNYTFGDAGQYRVELEVSDRGSNCTYKDSIADIIISDFMLWVPNAFSPTTSPGVNDIFKVAYKSVITFNGWIFNTWGNELFHWSDPSQGWDGKYRGKFVPPGTYYYVIEATSADGKKYVKKGDVNIVGGR